MSEKRRHMRIVPDENEPIEIQIMGSGFLDVLYARDISESGIGIKVPHHFEGIDIDKPVDLIITLPPDDTFKARGVIKHSNAALARKGIFGVAFTWFEAKHSMDVKQYVHAMIKRKRKEQ